MLVLDGPEAVDLSAARVLWVGVSDPDSEDAPDGGEGTQEWAGLGALRKNEMLTIPHTARAWTGDADVRAARRAAFEILGAVEDIVRANTSLGNTVMFCLAGVSNVQLRQVVGPKGAIADIAFGITAKARI